MKTSRLMAITWWAFAAILIFGLCLQGRDLGTATVVFGAIGMAFVVAWLILWLRDGGDDAEFRPTESKDHD